MKFMKAVVLEIKKNKAVVLSDDGMVKEVMNKNYEPGKTIEMERKIMSKMNKKYGKIAAGIAASLVIMLGGGTAYAYNTPVAHVSLDVNPGMIFSVNAFDRVIDVEMANKDAEGILLEIDWDGKNINNVIKDTISALKEENYLENEEWYSDSLMITVNATSTQKGEKLELGIKNELAKIVADETGKVIDSADLEENVIGVGAERVALASELGVTPGRLNLVQKLYDSDPELAGTAVTSNTAILFDGTVKDIMAKIKANRLGTTPKGIDVGNTDDSNIKNNGNNGNVNVNTKENNDVEIEMEKERKANPNQKMSENFTSLESIETDIE
jgi:hypothetical protein